jgi:hypothetical protein
VENYQECIMKRLTGLVLAAGLLASLGGCYYPAYQRPGVVYDDGTAVRGDVVTRDYDYDDGYYYAPAYYGGYGYGYYDPWYYGYGGPFIGLGFYGSYGHRWHGGHGNWHGGSHDWHGSHSGGSTHHGH